MLLLQWLYGTVLTVPGLMSGDSGSAPMRPPPGRSPRAGARWGGEAALARDAAAGGADALGMAGGGGSLAVVAAVAAARGIALACVPAGTRDQFALDVGVDRHDLAGALDAFADG